MVKIVSAHTEELDEADQAVAEILEQVKKSNLHQNSAGLISCHCEFIENGTVKKICEALSFPVIGLTTMSSADNSGYGMYQLSLAILTSDDCTFSASNAVSVSAQNYKASISAAYKEARGKLKADPSLIIAILPLTRDINITDILKHLDAECGGLPIWGSISVDDTTKFKNCQTICCGKNGNLDLAMLLVEGPVKAEFIVTALPDRNINPRKGIITESEGCLIKRVNNMTLMEYFADLGIELHPGVDATALPLIADYGPGGKAALGLRLLEDGAAFCVGEMPVGTSFSIGVIDPPGILETAEATITKALASGNQGGILMFPCVTRYLMLAPSSEDELKKITALVNGKIPYWLAYSGGEICPVRGADGKYRNQIHNYTFSALAL
jgi:hypothetical protein